jgi:uncharacterized protein YndB with AHSA1/START domain
MPEQNRQLIPLDGAHEVIDGRHFLRFERRFAHPIERVWAALTEPEQLKLWFNADEIELDLVEGGRFSTRVTGPSELVAAIVQEAGEAALETQDTVVRVQPPRLFEHTFGGSATSVVRWELQPDGDGCLLRLSHTEPIDFQDEHASRDLAGWHDLLAQLASMLEGRPGQFSMQRWQELKASYAAKLARNDLYERTGKSRH